MKLEAIVAGLERPAARIARPLLLIGEATSAIRRMVIGRALLRRQRR